MQLVEYEETQSLRCAYQLTVFGTREQEFQHHIVRKQNIWRVTSDRLSLQGILLLSRKEGKADRPLPYRITSLQELAEFLVLAVRQGIHWIHNDCLNPTTRSISQDVIDDWNDIGHALA